jgi:hypothetical protein
MPVSQLRKLRFAQMRRRVQICPRSRRGARLRHAQCHAPEQILKKAARRGSARQYPREKGAVRAHQIRLAGSGDSRNGYAQARRAEHPHEPQCEQDQPRQIQARIAVELLWIICGAQTLMIIIKDHRARRGEIGADDIGKELRVVGTTERVVREERTQAGYHNPPIARAARPEHRVAARTLVRQCQHEALVRKARRPLFIRTRRCRERAADPGKIGVRPIRQDGGRCGRAPLIYLSSVEIEPREYFQVPDADPAHHRRPIRRVCECRQHQERIAGADPVLQRPRF